MNKLPRKEDLLKDQQKDNSPEPAVAETSKENTDVKRAKEEAEIAESQAKKAEALTRIKLQERGYKTLEQGLKDAETKNQDAERRLAEVHKREEAVNKREEQLEEDREAIEVDKQKVKSAYAINKERETSAQARLDEAVKLEQKLKETYAQTQTTKREINNLVKHYNTYISPCIRVLRQCVQALDDIRLVLRYPKQYEKEDVFRYIKAKRNFIGKKCDALDRFVDASSGENLSK